MTKDKIIAGPNLYQVFYKIYGCTIDFERLVIAMSAAEALELSGLKTDIISCVLLSDDISLLIPGKYLE